jgi:hypothetical protein
MRARSAIVAAVALAACTSNPDPRHPTLAQMQRDGFGSWIILETTRGEIRGELIACDGELVHVRADTVQRVVGVPKSAIERARVFEYESEGGFGAWGGVGAASTISHGLFLLISLPAWMIVAGASAALEAGHVVIDYPDHDWPELARWARFPQGLPPGAAEKLDAIDDAAGASSANAPPLAVVDRGPRKPRFEPSIRAKTWLGVQLEALPAGSLDVSANGTTTTASARLGFGIGGSIERRLGDNVIVGFAPRFVTPVQLSGATGAGHQLDLRARVAVGGEVVRNLHLHGLGTLGYAWLFRAASTTDPMTGATSYATTSAATWGLGTRVAYTLHARWLLVSELSYQWSATGHAHVAVPTPVDVGIADRYLTIGIGVATALD